MIVQQGLHDKVGVKIRQVERTPKKQKSEIGKLLILGLLRVCRANEKDA